MGIYHLEDTPNLFITPDLYDNKYVYHMVEINGEDNRKIIRTIDLREDKLIIYGTQIEETSLQKLHDFLILRPKVGIVHVNCDGACYFLVAGKGCYRPTNNVIFDWSPFRVIVPNTRKHLESKNKQIHELSLQLLSSKVEMESSKRELKDLKDQLSIFNKERQDMEAKLQNVHDQLSSASSELESTMTQLEPLKEKVKVLENQYASLEKEHQEVKAELQKLNDEFPLVNTELESTKTQLEPLTKRLRSTKII